MRARSLFIVAGLAALCVTASAGCQADATPPPPPPPCDQKCQDAVAIQAIRETAKLAFNIMLQGKPVGAHDETTRCPFGGAVRVVGTATSNAMQGATEVDLTYVMDGCSYLFKDDDPEDNYRTKLTGTLTQVGVIAVQPTATSALVMKSDSITFEGTVYDPPIDYVVTCPVELAQNGNKLTGTICGREAVTDL
jgi:hypothetical protein